MIRSSAARLMLSVLLALAAPRAALATMPGPDGLPPEVAGAFAQGLFAVPDHGGLQTSIGAAGWLVPVIMVSFTDSTLRWDGPTLQQAMFDTTHSTPTGSVVDYWTWASGGRIRMRGEVVATVTLPHDDNYYANFAYGLNPISTPNNDCGLVRDAVGAADPYVDWNRYDRDGDGYVDMLWIVHAGIGAEGTGSHLSLWSITSQLSGQWSNGGAMETADIIPGTNPPRKVRIDRFTVLPELSVFRPGQLSEIGVYCHEFGHALGLPDLYDTSSLGGAANMGPGAWSLMSTGGWGGDGHSPQYPTSPGAWCMLYLGLVPKVQPVQDTVVTITPITSGGPIYEFFSQGASNPEHFLLEQRAQEGFDRNLPSSGLLVTQVDDAVIGAGLAANRINAGPTPGLRVLEGDGDYDLTHGWNRGDANDVLPGASNTTLLNDDTVPPLRMFSGAPTNLGLDGIEEVGDATRVRLRVRAAGWYPIENYTEAAYAPTTGFSRGHRATVTSLGDEVETFSDSRSGLSQVLLRTRPFGGPWGPATVVSQSSLGAYDPSIALLPGDGLAVVWEDLRDGQSQIYCRCRLAGNWGPERRVSITPGSSAAVAADVLGYVHVCWVDAGPPWPRLQYVRFPSWDAPGTPWVASDSLCKPSSPCLAATRTGGAFIVWPDFAPGRYVIDYAIAVRDSGMRPPLRLTYATPAAQPSVDVVADTSDAMHVVWQQVPGGTSELHYARHTLIGTLGVYDTTIVSSSDPVQNPSLGLDRTGALHLAFERSTALGQMVRYKRWRPGDGWDFPVTDVSNPAQGSASRVGVVAVTPGNVSILYASSYGGFEEERERRRRLDPIPTAVGDAPVAARAPALRLGPSPLPAGRELVVYGPAVVENGPVELYDAAGRRVATARARAGVARFEPALTRAMAPGLYFASVRGGPSRRLVVIR